MTVGKVPPGARRPPSPSKASALLGRCRCPECAYPDAEVRTDKNGDAYRYCEDCGAQYFTRGEPVKVRNLIASIRPVSPKMARVPAALVAA